MTVVPSLVEPQVGPPTPIAADRQTAAEARLTELDGRTVALFRVDGSWPGTDGSAEADVVLRALQLGASVGCPVVGLVHSVAVAPYAEGVAGLVAWGRVAREAARLSGVVPLLLAVTGPVHGGLAPLVGLADHVVVTAGSTAYINGPRTIRMVTGLDLTPDDVGGVRMHASLSGLASLVADDENDALAALADLLHTLPDNHLVESPLGPTSDPVGRPCDLAVATVPDLPSTPYDVRIVIDDLLDDGSFLEVHAGHATNVVCGFGRIGGNAIAVVANQPAVRAGTIDIAASCKAARHVQHADAFGIPLLTLVDTPGYEPGKDLEWRGMIRHGAKLVHAYAAATVPRVCVILRKSYGGAYIVMDSKTMGSDVVLAWPTAEIAVMGAPGAVAVLNRREIAEADDPDATRVALEDAYRAEMCTPRIAAQRGYVDQVIEPAETRDDHRRRLHPAAPQAPGPPRPRPRQRAAVIVSRPT